MDRASAAPNDPHLVSDMTVSVTDGMLAAPDQFPLGERFIRQSLLKRGGGGTVYRAFDLKLNREVAIRVSLQSKPGEPHSDRSFQREVLATSRLRSPYVVTLFDFEINPSEAILVTEFIDGETLHALLERPDRPTNA